MKYAGMNAIACLIALCASAGPALARDIFPYPIETRVLPNGLKVVMVPFDSPGIVAYYSVVRAGSRNEVEPGLSGFAHFFEHMMFRGTERYSTDDYNKLFKELGSDANAFTTDDYTCYEAILGNEGLEKVIEAESDRFMNLKYSVSDFQQESRAVLGEYYKNYSRPNSKLYEKLRDTAFTSHTYKHTTMGFLKDIEDMPNQYDYSLKFFDRFYQPGNVVVLIVGDFDPDRVMELIEKYYGKWEAKTYDLLVPVEPEQTSKRTAHIDWENPTLPYLAIAFHTPAFSTKNTDSAGLDILSELIFGRNSPLYQKLVIEDQSAESIRCSIPDKRDPGLFTIISRVKSDDLVEEVKNEIYEAIAEAREKPVDPKKLKAIKSRIRYSFAMRLDTAGSIARSLAHYLNLTGDPNSLNEIYKRYGEVSPGDLQRLAERYLVKHNCTEVTLIGVKN
ncbi:MAG: insulinase family protein [Candidatus Latescibacteria bacterium]|nr:insulinase family protein [Candidatus Latescibacterota bacterium]NIO00999.1 insulinase family protein [Candidatus Latescibacterota bacterium]NIO27398.1 insulinase family protein [Candidatus Latescibacterota bacterium]NIO54920.1 insulinase family protein [Candidatus Latescibacterota bacterium]NIT01009.1 insulinase family protein [Candidatus Latescibacterota bacterium]